MAAVDTVSDFVADAEKEMEDLFAPLKARDAEIAAEIDRLEADVRRLREVRKKIASLIRTSEPDYGKQPHSRNGKATTGPGISLARIARFGEFLVEHAEELNAMNDDQGFYASGLERTWADRLPSGLNTQGSISKCLVALRDQGVIRLHKVDARRGRNGTKYFKVVV